MKVQCLVTAALMLTACRSNGPSPKAAAGAGTVAFLSKYKKFKRGGRRADAPIGPKKNRMAVVPEWGAPASPEQGALI